MNMQAIRRIVMDMYPNATWHRKVHHMSDNQVFAIYRRAEEDKQKTKDIPKEEPKEDWNFCNSNHQIDIWEWLNDKEVTTNET